MHTSNSPPKKLRNTLLVDSPLRNTASFPLSLSSAMDACKTSSTSGLLLEQCRVGMQGRYTGSPGAHRRGEGAQQLRCPLPADRTTTQCRPPRQQTAEVALCAVAPGAATSHHCHSCHVPAQSQPWVFSAVTAHPRSRERTSRCQENVMRAFWVV